jgi:hypothetical protein
MRRFMISAASALALAGLGASGAIAARNPAGTGQPGTATPSGVSCPPTITSPNGFNSGGFANADTHYANLNTPSGNPHAVSEYDIACYQTSQH